MTQASYVLEIGALKVPVNFSKRENLVAVAADGVTEHPHAVPVAVSWPVTAEETLGVAQEQEELGPVVRKSASAQPLRGQ